MTSSPKQRAIIRNWYIDGSDRIKGQVYGHPLFEDGTQVTTSRVVYFDKEAKKAITKNTEYELGSPLIVEKTL